MCTCGKCAKLYMKKMWRDTHESGYFVYFWRMGVRMDKKINCL